MDRISPTSFSFPNAHNIPVRIFANEQVRIEHSAVDELQQMLDLQATVERIAAADPDFFGGLEPRVEAVAVTPDFHKGAGIPIGTILQTRGFLAPQAIGRDVNCGMRLMVTDWDAEQVRAIIPKLAQRIRHVFFEGGREIPLHPVQREALLRDGLPGLMQTARLLENKGLWRFYRPAEQLQALAHVSEHGAMQADAISDGLANYIAADDVRYDAQIGSIGGGNHFVEVQEVRKVHDAATAHAWGLKPGTVVVMIHTGSVSIGYPASGHTELLLRRVYPQGLPLPANGILPLPTQGRHRWAFDAAMRAIANAANFAYANRLFLSLMLRRVLEEELGDRRCELLWDSGHNLVWEQDGKWLHRKGATSARGLEEMAGTPFAWTGEPVLIPGSMGAHSFILRGRGAAQSLQSASHGAGRALSRGQAMKVGEAEFQRFMRDFHVITPVDPRAPQLRGRRDIIEKWEAHVKQEAPWAFKEIGPVIDTQTAEGLVDAVAEVAPIFTVKG